MIDTKELRRLAQAATPRVGHACKYQDAHWLREGHVDFENADLFIASERPQEDAAFYAASNPSAVIELLDRLEAAESDAAHQKALADSALRVAEGWEGKCNSLRAKIEAMERQAPAMWVNSSNIVSARINRERGGIGDQHTCTETKTAYHDAPLYALPGAKGEEK
jgi:hypothetical protein